MIIPDYVLSVLSRIEDNGFEAYVVGGCVRDSLMDKTPNDWDLTTSALPEDIQRIFRDKKVIPTGIKHGTVTVISKGNPIEITTFRIDGAYTDSRHPSNVTFSRDIYKDLERRDFTINAIAYNPKAGIIDPFGGQSDLKRGIIRTVGNPQKRFSEDALRIIRAIRFSATLNFEIEEETSAAIFSCCDLLKDIAAERISAELNKTLLAENPWPVLSKYLPVLIKRFFISTSIPTFSETCRKEHFFGISQAVALVLSQRLAIFLSAVTGGNIHAAQDFFINLKYDTGTRRHVIKILENLDIAIAPNRISVRKQLKALGKDLLTDILDVKGALGHPVNEAKGLLNDIVSKNQCYSLDRLNITGHDLKNTFELSGAAIGAALNDLLDAVIEEKCENKKDTLLSYFKSVSENIY